MADINSTLDAAITSRDMQEIRDTLVTFIIPDPGFSKGSFDRAVQQCISKGITEEELFVGFEGDALEENESLWTEDYYASLRTKFRRNFSKKRLDHLRKVGKKLFGTTQTQTPPTYRPQQGRPEDVKKNYQRTDRSSDTPTWVGVAVAAVVVAAVVGLVALVLG